MTMLHFDPDNTLAGMLLTVTPREAIRLGVELCSAVEQAVGADGVHGGVWPGNITWVADQAAIGPENRDSIADMSPDVLEFVSPELFWSGERSPASDVYSIGMVLYTALNKGVMPYFHKAEGNSPEERADALQSRMKGAPLPYPATAGRALGEAVCRAMAYRAEDRYATPGRLRAALEGLPEGADVPAAVPVVPLSEQERKNMPSYHVDKNIEEPPQTHTKRGKRGSGEDGLAAIGMGSGDASKTEQVIHTLVAGHAEESDAPAAEPPANKPKKVRRADGEVDENISVEEFRSPKKSKKRVIIPIIVVVVIIAALILLLKSCRGEASTFPVNTESLDVTPTEDPIHSAVPETLAPWAAVEPEETEEQPEPTEQPPEETETQPEETEAPVEPKYEMVLADVTWTRAKELAEAAGGHLATVRSPEQLREIIALAQSKGARFVWLGAYRDDNGDFRFVTGELMTYANWCEGEPSGGGEDYLLLWDINGWTYNDTINDVVTRYPRPYSGRTAYVIEYG